MYEKTIDNFRIYNYSDGRYLQFDLAEATYEHALQVMKEHQIDRLSLYKSGVEKEPLDLSVLKHFSFIKGFVCNMSKLAPSGLAYISQIESLTMTQLQPSNRIALSLFTNLKDLTIKCSPKITGWESLNELEELSLQSYKELDLTSLPLYPKLKELGIYQSRLESLNGIEKYPLIELLALTYLSKLTDISALKHLNIHLKKIYIHSCKRIGQIDDLAFITSLKHIEFDSCGKIDSFRPLASLPNLEWISCDDTNILDGDVTPFIGKKGGFMNKRHYSHTLEEIQKMSK